LGNNCNIIIISIRRIDKLHLTLKKHSLNEKRKQYYLKYRNMLTNTIKEVKTKFYKSELEKSGNDSKLNWKFFKNATNRSKTNNSFIQTIDNK